jgi:ABC-2 type transport system permease protein
MRKILSLIWVLLKSAAGSFDIKLGSKERKWAAPLFWGIIAVSLLPIMFIFYTMFAGLFAIFAPAGQLGFAVGLVLNLGALVIFFFSAFSAPAIFYLSKDVEYLLPLPLTPGQIIGAKFTVALVFEYAVALFIMAPMAAALIPYVPAAGLTVNAVLTFLTLPVVPLVYSTVIVMVLMSFSKFGRNRDMYNMLVGLIAVVFGLGIGMGSQRLAAIDTEQVLALLEGGQASLNALRSVFMNNIFAGRALAGEAFYNQLFNLAIMGLFILIFKYLGEMLYFKGAIGVSESSSPGKKMTRDDIGKAAQSRSQFTAYLQKELRLLFRSPIALLNCVLLVFLMPVILGVSLFVGAQGGLEELDVAMMVSNVNFTDPAVATWVMAGASAAGFFFSCMCSVTATAISREGRLFFVMKFIPVPYRTQLNAKAMSGLLVTLAGLLFTVAVLQIIFRAPFLIFAGVLLLTLPGAVFINYVGLLIDLLKPKLNWENEQVAVKQNVNVLFMMALGIVMAGVLAVLGLVLMNTSALAAFLGLFGVTGLLAFSGYYFVLNYGEELMARLN